MNLVYNKFDLNVDDISISLGFNYEKVIKDLNDVIYDRDISK